MALMTNIAGVPLFSTTAEALAWAKSKGLRGYHTHNHQGKVGYMGGTNHLQATGMPINTNAPSNPIPTLRTNRNSGGGY